MCQSSKFQVANVLQTLWAFHLTKLKLKPNKGQYLEYLQRKKKKKELWSLRFEFISNPLLHVDVFSCLYSPLFEAWNSEKYALFRPQTLVFVWEMVLKIVITFSAPSPIKLIHQVGARGVCAPFCFGGLKGVGKSPHLQEHFELVRVVKWP
jgi:hypothetical protein